MTQTVRSLEERLGVRLFNRTTRSVAVTEAGERLLTEIRPILEGVDRPAAAILRPLVFAWSISSMAMREGEPARPGPAGSAPTLEGLRRGAEPCIRRGAQAEARGLAQRRRFLPGGRPRARADRRAAVL